MKSIKVVKLKNDLRNAVLRTFADAVSKKENTYYAELYKIGMITPLEFLQNSEMKGEYLNEV
jgi:hypothetical protein